MLRHEGKKRGIRSISILLLTLVLMMAVSGCGKKNEKKEDTTEKVTTTTESQSESGETGESNFDFSQVFDNIEVNGKHVPFPFSLNDLGDEYTFDTPVDMGDGTFGLTLLYNGKKIAGAYVTEKNENDIGRKSEIYRLDLFLNEGECFKINGIGFDSSDSDIEKAFENMPVKYSKQNEKIGYSIIESGNFLDIFRYDGEITMITVIKGGK